MPYLRQFWERRLVVSYEKKTKQSQTCNTTIAECLYQRHMRYYAEGRGNHMNKRIVKEAIKEFQEWELPEVLPREIDVLSYKMGRRS